LCAVLLSRSGSITPIAIPATAQAGSPSIAWNGSTYLLAVAIRTAHRHAIELLRVSPAATVTAAPMPIGISKAAGPMTLELEPFGSGFLLFMHGILPNDSIHGARLDVTGTLLDPLTVVASTPLEGLAPTFGATGNILVYPRLIDHPTREITRVFAQRVIEGSPRRRAAGR
jgi:hypothetical protein